MTDTQTQSPANIAQIIGYVLRGCSICSDVPPRQVFKKVLGAPAVVVNDNGIKPLLSEKRSEVIDQRAPIVWHENLLAPLK
jgi:hypothetical protein